MKHNLFLICLLIATFCFSAGHGMAMAKCMHKTAKYKVTFYNFLSPTNANFTGKIPEDGLAFSPLTAISHSVRASFLAEYGYASPQVELICETGNNNPLITKAKNMAMYTDMVRTAAGSDGPTLSGKTPASVYVEVSCEQPMVTALSMIAPSPDWIVQVSNTKMYADGMFVDYKAGPLYAWDCGTDDGGEFTAPSDASLDMPSEPQLNIAPLYKDPTDRFGMMAVGSYVIEKVGASSENKMKKSMM